MGKPWLREAVRLALVVVVAALAEVAIGQALVGLVLGLLAYVVWTLTELYRLERWLRVDRKRLPAPDATGLWGEIYSHVNRLQQRNRKRKRKLASYLKRFQQSTAAMPDATVVLGPEQQIEWLNGAAERLLGLRVPQDVGQRIGNLVRHPGFIEFLESDGAAEFVEFPSPEDEGIQLSARLIHYGKNQRLLLARDTTRLHRLEQMRRDFVANVSHELRTPLTVIAGYVETMLDAVEEAPPLWSRSLAAMQEQTDRMRRLVDDLLLLSRLETAEEPASAEDAVAVPALIAAVQEEAELRSSGRHLIRAEVDPQLWLKGDTEQLRSVFNNLVHNAVQYTPEGGSITIRWYADDGGAHFQVADTGIGVAPGHLPRLTERFYRVDVGRSRERGGTGLGLAIVKHVLNRHDGTLHVQSKPGEGSTFRCDFPPERSAARPHTERRDANVVPLRGAV